MKDFIPVLGIAAFCMVAFACGYITGVRTDKEQVTQTQEVKPYCCCCYCQE